MQRRYERILAANPNDVRALNGKATALSSSGNYFAAIETYRKVLEREPQNIEALGGMGLFGLQPVFFGFGFHF